MTDAADPVTQAIADEAKDVKEQQVHDEAMQEAVDGVPASMPTVTAPVKKEVPQVPQPEAVRPEVAQAPAARRSFMITPIKKADTYRKILVYGDLGTGKTVLAASAQDEASMKDTLYISAEGGETSIAHRSDIDLIRINSFKQFADIYEFLRLFCIAREAKDKDKMLRLNNFLRSEEDQLKMKDLRVYKTVIIDSLSEVQKYVMYQLLGVNLSSARLDIPPDSPEFKEWGQNAEMIRLLVRSFRDLPMHVILVCGENKTEDEAKRIHRTPALPGKLQMEIGYFLDIVGYMAAIPNDMGVMQRRLYIQPGRLFTAKCRLRELDGVKYVDSPTMTRLLNARPEEATNE